MNQADKELLLARIVSGTLYIKIDDFGLEQTIVCKQPTRIHKYRAELIYQEAFREAELKDVFFEEEALAHMLENDIWSMDKEARLNGLKDDIEEIKVGLYTTMFKRKQRRLIRSKLQEAKKEVEQLYSLRHSYDQFTCHGYANMVKTRYLVGMSLYTLDDKPYYKDESFLTESNIVVEQTLQQIGEHRITEEAFRELARTDPWRTTWNAGKKTDGVFGVPSVDLTQDQKQLVIWSQLYDNIMDHPEYPGDDILKDDDRLDGWMIFQRRKREKNINKNRAESMLSDNEKIKNAGEVFIMAETPEDAAMIDELNDDAAAIVKAQRMNYLKKHGKVHEGNMPDSKRKIREQLTQLQRQGQKG